MQRFLVFSAACLLVTSASKSLAQSGPVEMPYRTFAPYYAGATVYSAGAHGFADIVRSAGMYEYLHSEAVYKLEKTRQEYIKSRHLWVQTYFDMRRINYEARQAEYLRQNPPHTQEDFNRYAMADAPKRLSATRLDPITGYIAWPRWLLRAEFTDLRRDLERLFAQRAAAQGAIGVEKYNELLDKIALMQERLRATIHFVKSANDTRDYNEARRFLDSLAYEAGFRAG